MYQALVMNRKSSVVHAKADAGKLLCGRNHTQEYSDIPKVVQLSAFPFCSQCERAKISRFNVGGEQQNQSAASVSVQNESVPSDYHMSWDEISNLDDVFSPPSEEVSLPDLEDD